MGMIAKLPLVVSLESELAMCCAPLCMQNTTMCEVKNNLIMRASGRIDATYR